MSSNASHHKTERRRRFICKVLSCPVPNNHSWSKKNNNTVVQVTVGLALQNRQYICIPGIECVVWQFLKLSDEIVSLLSCPSPKFLFPSVQQEQSQGERQEYTFLQVNALLEEGTHHSLTHSHTPRSSLKSPINLMCMNFDSGRKPECLAKPHIRTERTW